MSDLLIFFLAVYLCFPGDTALLAGFLTGDALLSPYLTVRVIKVPLRQL